MSSELVSTDRLIQVVSAISLLWLISYCVLLRREKPSHRTVAILVLGDIGRSPRMMYHAECFAQHNFMTYLVGYGGSRPVPSLLETSHVRILHLTEPPKFLTKLPFLILAPIKILLQILSILQILLVQIPHPPEFLMVQNPPSIPTLALAWAVCSLRGSKLIIDWHNLGYSILALRLGQSHPLVTIAKQFEAFFGRTAFLHLFVTQAMRDHLTKEWSLKGTKIVLHDRPPAHFHRASAFESHELFLHLNSQFSSKSLQTFLPTVDPPRSTIRTQLPHNATSSSASPSQLPALRPDRPALLVSSTSWTPDEDFSILLEALKLYEQGARKANQQAQSYDPQGRSGVLPKMLVIVTGKGPLKEKYMDEVRRLEVEESWQFVRCRDMWLEARDYPLLLGSADFGVCLHSSSSALDLPMKIVDMFGCGIPVCALDFACLPELVIDGKNGLIFKTASQLSEQMQSLLKGYPNAPALKSLRSSLEEATKSSGSQPHEGDGWEWGSWAENWDKTLRPLIQPDHIQHS